MHANLHSVILKQSPKLLGIHSPVLAVQFHKVWIFLVKSFGKGLETIMKKADGNCLIQKEIARCN